MSRTPSDRKALIRFASTLPVGSAGRKAILAGLSRSLDGKVTLGLDKAAATVDRKNKVISYRGEAQELIDHAEKLGWEFIEDSYVDSSDMVDWDKAAEDAIAFIERKGWEVEYD